MKEVDNKKSRFQDADWFKIGPQSIVIGGAGGIGSWVSLFLSRIGHELYIYDNDTIDETNMAGQLYPISAIGSNKAEATKEMARNFSGNENISTFGLFDENSLVAPIVFSCFDNMAARKLMFEKWAEQEDREVFIDGRMLSEVGNVLVVQKGEEDRYRAQLFEDSEVEEAPCSFKATSHCGALIASLMVSNLNNYLSNKHLGLDIRVINFKTDFELPIMHFENVLEPITEELC